jgi:hypothetical protein
LTIQMCLQVTIKVDGSSSKQSRKRNQILFPDRLCAILTRTLAMRVGEVPLK